MAMDSRETALMEWADTREAIEHVEEQLIREYGPVLPEELVRACVQHAIDDLGETRVNHFVPVLAERLARRELAHWMSLP